MDEGTLIGLVGSELAIRAVHKEWERLLVSTDQGRRLPVLQPPSVARALAQVSSWGTCVVTMVVWVAIVVLTVYQI